MNEFIYNPIGVCSREMKFIIENDIIRDIKIIGGCPGYSKGLTRLLIGMNIDEVITKLKGTKCGMKATSCPEQIALALENYKKIKV
ncbi:MAG: TIGR03905 family TSCPD domain-containing protein [Bacilli bacterium]